MPARLSPVRRSLRIYLDKVAPSGDLYCIEFKYLGQIERQGPDLSALSGEDEWRAVAQRLAIKDKNSNVGAWTTRTLEAVKQHPGLSSAKLSVLLKREQKALKVDMRKLKALGLTLSLETGYKLSERGESYLRLGLRI